ncbi:MAG: hypothetical protein E7374_03500 [Clostridiales bacterium]|nr:hypothetical protein [Clostridiales bacterium]
MNKKSLIFSYALTVLSVATLLIMLMPILDGLGMTMFGMAKSADKWYNFEEYLWGIGAIIAWVCLPLLIVSSILTFLSACDVIKCKVLDKILYIVNIVLASLVVAVIVNYTLGYARSLTHTDGIQLFKGTTYFKYVTPYYFWHCILSIGMLVVAIFTKKKSK